jgi:vanillate O-demethylase ferredoxin subunit
VTATIAPRPAAAVAGSFATVEERAEPVPGIAELVLRPDRPVPRIPPGSHIDVTVLLPGGPETRSYSLVDLGHADGRYRIAVRLDAHGRGGSRWMHALRPGAVVAVGGPIDGFAPSPGRRPSVLLAGGIGVTPIVGLARAARTTDTVYRVVYAGRSRDHMAFVDHLEQEHPGRVTVVESGRGTPLRPDAVVAGVPAGGVLYVCGPMRLLTAVRGAWQRAGRPPADLRFETFGTSGALPTTAFTAVVPARGLCVDVSPGSSLLEALEAAGVELMYDCLRGECGLCRVRVLAVEGRIDHRDVFLSARQHAEDTTMCACVSRLAGGSVSIDC